MYEPSMKCLSVCLSRPPSLSRRQPKPYSISSMPRSEHVLTTPSIANFLVAASEAFRAQSSSAIYVWYVCIRFQNALFFFTYYSPFPPAALPCRSVAPKFAENVCMKPVHSHVAFFPVTFKTCLFVCLYVLHFIIGETKKGNQ